jgi:dipeptidyl aminopeptidase/acylaminoacyl peptidase
MQRDIRNRPLFEEASALYLTMRRPGTGQVSDAVDLNASKDGQTVVFSSLRLDELLGVPQARVYEVELSTGLTNILTSGPNTDHAPKYSPDGRQVAFLSDRQSLGDYQLYLLDRDSGVARSTPRVDGWVEYFHWSPDGDRILLGVAGHGADFAGGQGGTSSSEIHANTAPPWMPRIETGEEAFRWRRLWLYEFKTDTVRMLDAPQLNIWESAWCGDGCLACVASLHPAEGSWYFAHVWLIDADTGTSRELYTPKHQLGGLAGSASGKRVAIIEAVCSDRGIVAGDVVIIDTDSANCSRLDTRAVDISCIEWRSDEKLLLGGHRGFETVFGRYDVEDGDFVERWVGKELTSAGRYASMAGINDDGDCVFVAESFLQAPELAVICEGEYKTIKSFDRGYSEYSNSISAVQMVTWRSSQVDIQGWLLCPHGPAPYATVMVLHGGPVWHWRPTWLGRSGAAFLMLLRRGYAIFFPNPRGSGGRGQEFARSVFGDMGGPDACDLISGVDALVERGIADPKRLGVMGASYGGFLTAWLVTQYAHFAAAIAIAPHTNQVSEHLTSNIPEFMSLITQDRYDNPTGLYFQRSPIMHAHKVKAPVLSICGALDRSTPPSEAMQFHNALLESDLPSVLVTYPEEGHGVHKFPAMIDFAARVVGWFEKYLRADKKPAGSKR